MEYPAPLPASRQGIGSGQPRRFPGHGWPVVAGAGHLLLLTLLMLVGGCSRKPAELHRMAIQAEAEARQAFERHDVPAAERAAVHAEDAESDLKRLVGPGALKSTGTELGRLVRETAAAARSARNYAQLALEEQQCRKQLGSLKIRTYKSVRDAIWSYGLDGLAPLAEQLAKAETNAPSFAPPQLVSLVRRLAELTVEHSPSTSNAPDWALAAAHLRAASTNPPPRLALFLGFAFAVSGLTDFALCEIESVHPSTLVTTNSRSLYHLERGALYALHGWDRTAARELDLAMRLSPHGWNGLGTTQALAVFHFWLADHALQRKHYAQADLDFAEGVRAWPGNPLAPFVQGERLAAHGEWTKAAEALEAQAAATGDPWLAKHLGQRARQIREAKGSAAPLFSSPVFVLEMAVHTLGESGGSAAALQKVQQFINDAMAFAEWLTPKLPGQ